MRYIKWLWVGLLLCSCSARQVQLKSELVQAAGVKPTYFLVEEVTVKASHARPSVLRAGTTWLFVGRIEQGYVYRTKDQVVIVNSFDVHEGYIVVREGEVAGYYLPVGKTFVASDPVKIIFDKKEV